MMLAIYRRETAMKWIENGSIRSEHSLVCARGVGIVVVRVWSCSLFLSVYGIFIFQHNRFFLIRVVL